MVILIRITPAAVSIFLSWFPLMTDAKMQVLLLTPFVTLCPHRTCKWRHTLFPLGITLQSWKSVRTCDRSLHFRWQPKCSPPVITERDVILLFSSYYCTCKDEWHAVHSQKIGLSVITTQHVNMDGFDAMNSQDTYIRSARLEHTARLRHKQYLCDNYAIYARAASKKLTRLPLRLNVGIIWAIFSRSCTMHFL